MSHWRRQCALAELVINAALALLARALAGALALAADGGLVTL